MALGADHASSGLGRDRNGRPNAECIFKRLDRIFVNLPFQNLFPNIKVENLIRTSSDHAPFIDELWGRGYVKLKRVKTALSQWSKLTFGDIFKQLAIREDISRVDEMLFEDEPTIENMIVLQQVQAELKKYLSIEEQYWKQKAGMNWFAGGDRNTRFFHTHVNGKRQKLQLKIIQNGDGDWLESEDLMANAANLEVCKFPTIEEVKGEVFALSGDSASRPDGFIGLFYKHCWDIVGEDIFKLLQEFYGGASLTKSITHTNLVLLPKKPQVQTFSNLRPISLSNFINKEIVTDIRLRGKPSNVVIKLDMANAYDRVSWKYLLHVLRKMGRWVKQGDPLSPALLILSAKVLSRSLNKLFEDKRFIRFGMPKWTDPLNHLAYADDTIIFASADPYSLGKVVEVLTLYEQTSGQLINKTKSSYYMHTKVAKNLVDSVGGITGFQKGKFPFTYLGCPILYTRRRKDYYNDLIKKVKAKLHFWKGKLLSFGGKATLITSVLQSLPTRIPSVLDLPDNVLEYLHKMFDTFFWSTKEEGRSRHWTKWLNLCLPKE
uniref:Reverse transcriptase domain-containing protein n=1 Tax=Nicotiana tabacum TaxID=4097 RepID=A0A1S4ASS5_TOBAC|nr:PREDICTED: uncharacterized protein LOC107801044 [Nicotiana tabacum]